MFEINLIKNQIYDLSNHVKILKEFFNYDLKKEHLKKINIDFKHYKIWSEPKLIHLLNKKRSFLGEEIVNTIDVLIQDLDDVSILLDLAIESNDKEIFNEVVKELIQLKEKLNSLEFRHMFSGKYDSANCYLDLQAGSGGIEAQDWASMLMRMYLRWSESKGFKSKIIEELNGNVTGLKSATIKIVGKYAYGWLRTETGVHRLVRKSPFDSCGRRHTSFSSVFIYPEVNDNINIKINPDDLRIDVYRASGAGGQHVNKTESAVRITHMPTGIVVQCQNDRSQHKNKDQAFKQLKLKLHEFEMQKKNSDKKLLEDNKSNISWGSQIRSYILDDSRIKDLRTGVESRNVQAVLNGDLDEFIRASLKSDF